MKYLIYLILFSQSFLENYSQSPAFKTENKNSLIWKKRRAIRDVDLSPKEMILHLENKMKSHHNSNKDIRPFNPLPKENLCGDDPLRPSYAKTVCTSYPGRVVCTLGRYTFVINNGDHHMEPEVIERFAAMVYHRTQEGDTNFDVAVNMPEKEECFCPEPAAESTTREKEVQLAPAYIECTPIKEERKLCNPAYTPTEVIYSCKRKQIGIGKRMVISVDKEGTVRNGDLVLPYSSLITKRLKRQKSPGNEKISPRVKTFTDECSSSDKKWCPSTTKNLEAPSCNNEGCITTTNSTACGPSKTRVGLAADKEAAEPGEAVLAEPTIPSIDSPDVIAARLNGDAELAEETRRGWRGGLSRPQVKMFTDECNTHSEFPWCLKTVLATECDVEGCVTRDECSPQTPTPRTGRKEAPGTRMKRKEASTSSPGVQKANCPLDRYRQKLLNTRTLGYKHPVMQKRQLQGTYCTTSCPTSSTFCPPPTTSCGPMPNPPVDVPCCQSVPSKQPPPCCPETKLPSCPPKQPCQQTALRSHWRRRRKPRQSFIKLSFADS